jgi:hypothetical protein
LNEAAQRVVLLFIYNTRDQKVTKQLRDKLASMQGYVDQLRTSEVFIKQNQASRQARNALTKF